ncbi:PQQ-dependent sugar dehydrogenase [Sphingobacterium paludis]|uniref:PQQ-dependent dehydrogenase (S-GDH family) n=1 Tax=Sphingobacterium paludis TaxID=1476465 RepID=A0A4R7CZD1_9SPHI|nr:PQQ-dependent sugar dehydrogenase [Sphingobacterium paludis]TDS13282.1 PQQ-dependent dehydrogenase (s-GDH family) [Sphingobacterium paludis]
MRKLLYTLLAISIFSNPCSAQKPSFKQSVIASNLQDPWSIAIDGEGYLWVTESKSYKILCVNPSDGAIVLSADLSMLREFPRYDTLKLKDKPWPQGGLMGLVLHPNFDTTDPYLFVAYVYKHVEGNRFLTRLSRFRFDKEQAILTDETILDNDVPGSNDHNGGRLAIHANRGFRYLYYAVGDMGAGQYSNGGRANSAQDATSKEGKILRFLADPDTAAVDQWIPSDNPFNTESRSAVYSVGHRNPQGLACGQSEGFSLLFSCEHGPMSDDEVNIIEKGKNYGHPLIVGYADGNYNGLSAAVSDDQTLPGPWHSALPVIADEQDQAYAFGDTYRNPIYSFAASDAGYLKKRFARVRESKDAEWESIAPSSLAFYNHQAIPDWKNSLLVTALKTGLVYRLTLSADGRAVIGDPEELFSNKVRYRDICLSPDGKKIYLITDRSAITSGPTEENPKEVNLRGCIVAFKLVE